MAAGVTLLILAAGAARRMRGRDKLLMPVNGVPLLRHLVQQALACGLAPRVALRPGWPGRAAALAGLAHTAVPVPDADEGMAAAIRAGAAGVRGALMILPADMPDIDGAALALILAAHADDPAAILRGASGDRPGHPVLIPADLVPALAGLRGDCGARAVIAAHPARLRLVPLPGETALTDLDTPEDWARWHSGRG